MRPTYKTLSLEERGPVACLTLNRPEALNAITTEMAEELIAFAGYLESTPGLRAAVITGCGEKAFAAGADIGSLRELSPVENFCYRPFARAVSSFEEGSKPVIAAINGYALGGGFELALGCDLRIASENALMGFPETGLAIIPGAGGTARLAKNVGLSLAKELILTGRRMDAREALRHGLVTKVVSQENLMDEALKLAQVLLKKGPVALSFAKKGIRLSMDVDTHSALLAEGLMAGLIFSTEDRAEGAAAFSQHRKPEFQGK